MPAWMQELAALATVSAAAVWLVVHWLKIGRGREVQPGCARCDRNALPPGPAPRAQAGGGRRSRALRVLS